jgi:hypothetical protein
MSHVDDLIDKLASEARPTPPLKSPLERALGWLGAAALLIAFSIYLFSDVQLLITRHQGREELMALEMAAMLATGALAVVGAFFVAIPGRSRRWLFAPVVPLTAWLLLSGAGCYRDLVHNGPAGLAIGHSFDCLFFIVTVSLLLGAPLVWLLSRARPIDPVPVALLGGLGTAALAAFTLQFFHPFAVTFVDLAFHLVAIGIVVGAAALLNRRTLSPA